VLSVILNPWFDRLVVVMIILNTIILGIKDYTKIVSWSAPPRPAPSPFPHTKSHPMASLLFRARL
jgi:hypothetical protein